MRTPLSYLILISLCLLSAACSTSATRLGRDMAERNGNVFTIDVEPGLGPNQVKQAILLTLDEREWTVVTQRDNTFVAELDRLRDRKIFGRISIWYTKDQIRITDLSFDGNGRPFVSVRWICYLQRSLVKHMSEMQPLG